MQYDETTPKYLRYVVNILQEMKTTKTIWVSRVDVKIYTITTSQVRIWNLRAMMSNWTNIWDVLRFQPK